MSRLLAKHWAIALVVSLALNLFLGGMLLGRGWQRSHGPPRGMSKLRLRSLGDQLGAEGRSMAEKVDAKHAQKVRERWLQVRDARDQAIDALCAEPFDQAKAQAAHDELMKKETAARQAMHGALVELAAALPAADRAKLGEAMRKGQRRRGLPGNRHRKTRDRGDGGRGGRPVPERHEPPPDPE